MCIQAVLVSTVSEWDRFSSAIFMRRLWWQQWRRTAPSAYEPWANTDQIHWTCSLRSSGNTTHNMSEMFCLQCNIPIGSFGLQIPAKVSHTHWNVWEKPAFYSGRVRLKECRFHNYMALANRGVFESIYEMQQNLLHFFIHFMLSVMRFATRPPLFQFQIWVCCFSKNLPLFCFEFQQTHTMLESKSDSTRSVVLPKQINKNTC